MPWGSSMMEVLWRWVRRIESMGFVVVTLLRRIVGLRRSCIRVLPLMRVAIGLLLLLLPLLMVGPRILVLRFVLTS